MKHHILAAAVISIISLTATAQTQAIKKLADLKEAFQKPAEEQDTTKKTASPAPAAGSNTTQNSGSQSNLAVTDEGAPADKPKSDKKRLIENPVEKIKVKATQNAAQNQGSGAGTSNLAVTDEGVGADKSTKGKTNKQAGTTNPTPEPAPAGTQTVTPR